MPFPTHQQLTARLESMERALESARTQIGALEHRARRTRRARAGAAIVALMAMAVLVGSRTNATYAQAQGQTVTAPFTVVSSSGKKLVEVRDEGGRTALCVYYQTSPADACLMGSPEGGLLVTQNASQSRVTVKLGSTADGDGVLALWNRDGELLADISRGENGGQGIGVYSGGVPLGQLFGVDDVAVLSMQGTVLTKKADGSTVATLGQASPKRIRGGSAEGEAPTEGGGGPTAGEADSAPKDGLMIYNAGAPVVRAYANAGGNGSLSVQAKDDQKHSAVIGVTPNGPAVVLNAAGGGQRAAFAVLGGKPTLEMKNTADAPILQFTEGDAGNARLQLGNAGGDTMVEAGVLPNGHGIVRVYPWKATTPGMLLGLPGTYIVGNEKK